MSYNLIMATSRHYTAGFTQAEFKVFSDIMSEFVYLKKDNLHIYSFTKDCEL